jgi:hypothetical protein
METKELEAEGKDYAAAREALLAHVAGRLASTFRHDSPLMNARRSSASSQFPALRELSGNVVPAHMNGRYCRRHLKGASEHGTGHGQE